MGELVLNEDNIKSRIYTLRNMQVMLDKDLAEFMVSQNAVPSRKHLGGSLPYVFTEQGK